MRASSAIVCGLLAASFAVLPGCQAQNESNNASKATQTQQSAEAEVDGQSVSLGALSCVVPNDWSVSLNEEDSTLRLLSNNGVCVITGPVSLHTVDLASYAAAAYKGVSGNANALSKMEEGAFAGYDCYRFDLEFEKATGETIIVEHDGDAYTVMYEIYSDKDGSDMATAIESISFN